MFEELVGESIHRRRVAEALSCQDVLRPAPPRPTLVARLSARIDATARGLHRLPRRTKVAAATPQAQPRVVR